METGRGGTRRRLGELPLSVELVAGWPVEETGDAASGGLYQAIADSGGRLFARWGERGDLAAFRGNLEDLLTRTVKLAERPVEVLGRPALRLDATVERSPLRGHGRDAEGDIVPIDDPGGRFRVVGISLATAGGVPVLLGYRLPVAAHRQHRARLREFLSSLAVEPRN